MKIALVIGALDYGGAERVISNLANYFSRKKHEVVLISIFKKNVAYTLDEKVKLINGLDETRIIKIILKLRGVIKSEKPNVVLSFLTHINIATIFATFGLGIPIIVSERNDPKVVPREPIRRFLRGITYFFASGLVFQTKQAQRHFVKAIRKKSAIIPNPLFLNSTSDDKKTKEIVSVGRLVPQKRHDMIIKSFHELTNRYDDYVLNIYGEGEQRNYLEQLIKKLHLEKKVFLKGTTKDLHNKMKNAEIFILASDYEGMPNALMEAMALGIACISTNCSSGGPAFLINHLENGLLIPVGDQYKLTYSLNLLLSNENLRSKLSSNAIKIVEKLSPEVVYEQWNDYVNRVSKLQK